VHLTIDMDKALMNRPFYWQYTETLGQQGIPQKLSFQRKKSEMYQNNIAIHLGSPWFHKVFNELKTNATKLHCFEKVTTSSRTMLHPWLVLNVLMTYKGTQQKESLHSIGLN